MLIKSILLAAMTFSASAVPMAKRWAGAPPCSSDVATQGNQGCISPQDDPNAFSKYLECQNGVFMVRDLAAGTVCQATDGYRVIGVTSGQSGAHSDRLEIMFLTQATFSSKLIPVDANRDGDLGDFFVFESPLLKEGKPFGEMFGTMTKVGELGHGTHPDREYRLLNSVFDLPDGEIAVQGLSFYLPSQPALNMQEAVSRAIVGGTRAYAGIRGEVITTHNDDDTYTQELRYWK
jgi:hypothetical protein